MNIITKETLNLLNVLNSNEECIIEISKDRKFIVRINKDDKLRYIGSKYSVEKDIQEFINNIGKIDENTTLIVFGLGAGEHIKYILNNLSSTNKIFIVEPSTSIIVESLKLSSCMDIIYDDRVALCIFSDKLKKYMKNFIDDNSIANTKLVVFTNYATIFENDYKTIIDIFNAVKNFKNIGNNTFNVFSELFFNNFIENVFGLEKFYAVNSLKGLFKDKPAILVSSGPSLTKNIHLLKEVQDRFIIISGPRTVGALINNGVVPDFVCDVDPQDKTFTQLEKYIDFEIPLVFMDSTDNKIVKEQKGIKIIAANQGMEKHLEDMLGIKVDSLMQGGSVAHFCMGLAVYLGCKTIIFIGQDLAYTDEKFQAEGTYFGEMDEYKYRYENDRIQWDMDRNHSLFVKDIYGNVVRTSIILNSYREEFEELIFDCNEIEFINSTQGGANIEGTKVMDLKESINLYGVEKLNKNLSKLFQKPIELDEDVFVEKIFRIVDKMENIKRSCEDGIELADQMLHFYKYNKYCDLNRIFNKLDEIDATIGNKENLGLLAYKLISQINNIMNNEDFKEKEDENELELGIRLAKKNTQMYLTVIQTVEEAIYAIRSKFIYVNFNV